MKVRKASRSLENVITRQIMCFYKFKPVKLMRSIPDSLEVSYPPSVWEETKQSVKNSSEGTSDKVSGLKMSSLPFL